jgi:hypothetical protein
MIATALNIQVRFPAGAYIFLIPPRREAQTHSSSYPIQIRDSFPKGKAI